MIPLTPAESVHLRLLERWRHAMDLIGPGPAEPHFEDAAAAVSPLAAEGDWVDLGSGAGFPGVALAARFPDAKVLLVEPRQKRATFLDQVVREARLQNATVRRGRDVELPDGAFDGVIARAFAPPEELVRVAARLLRPGGRVALMLARGEAPEAPGFEPAGSWEYDLDGRPRRVVVLRRLP